MKTLRRRLLLAALLACVGVWVGLLLLARSYEEEPYTRIEDGLYLGRAVPQPPPGTRAVVNLCGARDPYTVDAALWEPILEGGDDPTVEGLRRVVEFIAAQRRAGRTTYVHCGVGMNRSGMVMTAYLMSARRWRRDQALAFVQSKRPQVQPNPALMRLLAEWELVLRE
jgi:hypothetical protein